MTEQVVWVNLAHQVLHYRQAAVKVSASSCRGLGDALRAVRGYAVLDKPRTLSILPLVGELVSRAR